MEYAEVVAEFWKMTSFSAGCLTSLAAVFAFIHFSDGV